MKFFLKKMHELSEKDFELSQIWAIYYEPDDIDTLIKLGYDFDDVQSELKKVNYSDDYAFPVPVEGADESYQYLYYAINATLACGTKLKGYCSSRRAFAIFLFHCHEKYGFNLSLKEMGLEAERKLKKALGKSMSIFPIQIEILPLNKKGIFWYQEN